MRACALAAVLALSTSGAALRVPDRDPLTVHGWRFHSAERVVVTVTAAGGRASRTTTTGSTGAFTVRFRSLHLDACDTFQIRAVGDRGSRASFKPPPPACGAPLGP